LYTGAAREQQLKIEKKEEERKQKFKPEEKARKAHEEVARMDEESKRLLIKACDVRTSASEASIKAFKYLEK
jgi:hypothetical protein